MNLSAYAGKHSYIIVPGNTFSILEQRSAGDLPEVASFLESIRDLPRIYTIKPQPWRLAGPELQIYAAP